LKSVTKFFDIALSIALVSEVTDSQNEHSTRCSKLLVKIAIQRHYWIKRADSRKRDHTKHLTAYKDSSANVREINWLGTLLHVNYRY
jgi:ribosomal protein L35